MHKRPWFKWGLASAAVLAAGGTASGLFQRVDTPGQALKPMRLSALAARQQTHAALHDIAAGAYFADATTCPQLSYSGAQKI